MKKYCKKIKEERAAATIVEAAVVMPVMIFILAFLILLGNAYFQMSKIDAVVARLAVDGAAQCIDPFYDDIVATKGDDNTYSVPLSNNDIQPYRYVIGVGSSDSNIGAVKAKVKEQLKKAVSDCGFFAGMEPTITFSNVEYNNYFFYATFVVEVHYKVTIPIRLLGESEFKILDSKARAEAPVNDPADFILNTDMVLDYVEASEVGNAALTKISDAMAQVKKFLGLGG